VRYLLQAPTLESVESSRSADADPSPFQKSKDTAPSVFDRLSDRVYREAFLAQKHGPHENLVDFGGTPLVQSIDEHDEGFVQHIAQECYAVQQLAPLLARDDGLELCFEQVPKTAFDGLAHPAKRVDPF